MGTRAMTTQPRRLHQSQVPDPTSGEEEVEGGGRGGGGRGEVMELEERGGYGQWDKQQQHGETSSGAAFILNKPE